jgi:hypothetical protein
MGGGDKIINQTSVSGKNINRIQQQFQYNLACPGCLKEVLYARPARRCDRLGWGWTIPRPIPGFRIRKRFFPRTKTNSRYLTGSPKWIFFPDVFFSR